MPITQSRMLSLIRAAQDYKNALRSAQQIVKTNLIAARQGHASPADALEQIGLMVTEFGLLQHKIESAETIMLEAQKFNPRAVKENERQKAKARAKRGSPVPLRHETESTSPPDIYRTASPPATNPRKTTAPDSAGRPAELADNAYQAAMRVAAQLDAEEMQESLSPALREAFRQPPDELPAELPVESEGQFADLPDLSTSPPAISSSPSPFNAQALNAEAEAAVRGQATETKWTKLIADAQAKERAEFEARRASRQASHQPDSLPIPNPPDEKASES